MPVVLVYLAMASLGFALHQSANILPADHISNFADRHDHSVILEGRVIDDPVSATTFYGTDKSSFVVSSDKIKKSDKWYKTSGLVKVNLYQGYKRFSYGERALIEGTLERPASLSNPGLFDYSKYLAMMDIRAVMKVKEGYFAETQGAYGGSPIVRAAYKVRHALKGIIEKYLTQPCSGFIESILIGDRSGLRQSLTDEFIKTGTVHILSISGLHITLIAGIIAGLLALFWIPKKANLVLTLIAVTFYAILAGANPPMVRSVIMFAVFAIGYLADRDSDILNSLSLAAFLILLCSPKELFDPSFQLSFISIGSMIIFTPIIEPYLGLKSESIKKSTSKTKRYILTGIAASGAAWLGTAPLVALYFNIVSPVAMISNLVIVPALTLLTAASFAFLAICAIPNPFAFIAAMTVKLITQAVFFANHLFAELPLAYFRVRAPGVFLTALYYVFCFAIVVSARGGVAGKIFQKKRILIAALIVLNVVTWKDLLVSLSRTHTEVTFLDVGQGDSSFVRTADRYNVLVDGGSGGNSERFDAGRSVVAPYLWNKGIRRLDAVVVSHYHEDHLGGLIFVLENFKVGCVIESIAPPANSNVYRLYEKILRRKKIKRIRALKGDEVVMGKSIMRIMNPGSFAKREGDNENSLVFKFEDDGMSVLYCGDITAETMQDLISEKDKLISDIVKVPHHAQGMGDEGTVKKFFSMISPEVLVVSSAAQSRYASSSEKSEAALLSTDAKIFNTSSDGAVIISKSRLGLEIKKTGKNI
jgi:competence protein ComEC